MPSQGGPSQPIEVFEYAETESRQRAKLMELRRQRDAARVEKAMDNLRRKCHSDENLYPHVLEAIKALATLGEIQGLFRKEFGLWPSPLVT